MPLPWPLATLQPHSQPQAFLEPTCRLGIFRQRQRSQQRQQRQLAAPLSSGTCSWPIGVAQHHHLWPRLGFIPNLWRCLMFWASWLYGFNPASPQPSKEAYVVLPAKNPPWSNSRGCSCHFHKCLPATCIVANDSQGIY